MPNIDVSVPLEGPDFDGAAAWIEEENQIWIDAYRKRIEAEREAELLIQEKMYGPIRDQLGLPTDPPDSGQLEAFTEREYERLVAEQQARIEDRGVDSGMDLLLPPQTSSCVKRTSRFSGAYSSPVSKAHVHVSNGTMSARVSANSFKADYAVAGMGYWFRAGAYLSGYKATAYTSILGLGALNGWFATARIDCDVTLRVFNWNSRNYWSHTERVPGGSIWFGALLGAGFSALKRVSTFCQADKGDWLYLHSYVNVSARASGLGHASVAMTGDVLLLELCG